MNIIDNKNFWWKRILIGWVEWVWKTSIINWCLEKNSNLEWFFFWKEFVYEAKKDQNFNWFENLTIKQRKEIEKKINKKVEKLNNENLSEVENLILFDAHYTIFQNWEYINCIDSEFVKNNFDYLILIKLRSDEIINRIKSDNKNRTSISDNISKLDYHQKLEELRVKDLAKKCNLKLLKINNLNLNNSIDEILKVVNYD